MNQVGSATLATNYSGQNSSSGIEISIELVNGAIPLKVDLNNTVEQVKKNIHLQTGHSEEITLLYEGETLEDDRTLASYGITKNSILFQAVDAIQSNKCFGIGFAFNKLVDVEQQTFAKTGPDYWTVDRGLNLRGKCTTSTCQAFNQVVWIQKGMGTFDIGMEAFSSECPICKKTADKIDNLGFWNCLYTVEGFQLAPEKKKVKEENKVAGKEKFTTFKQSGDLANWSFLKITTKPIQ